MILHAAGPLGELGKASEGQKGTFLWQRDLILTVEPGSWLVLWAGGGSQMEAQPCPGLATEQSL